MTPPVQNDNKRYSRIISISFLLIICLTLTAFGQPCNFPFSPSNTCQTAPLVCSLDGYCSRNTDAINSGTPNAFCGQVENNNWIAFIAGSTTFEVRIMTSNCSQGNGLQAQFFSTNNCSNFTAVSNCLNPVNGSDNLTCSNLVIGEQYYLMMDGKNGDVCDYEYTLISGTILSPADVFVDPVSTLCEGGIVTINSTAVSPNSTLNYTWSTLDGNIISDPLVSAIVVDAPGAYTISVEDLEGCTALTTVDVVEVPLPGVIPSTPDILNCVSNTTETLNLFLDPPNGMIFQFEWETPNGNFLSGTDTEMPVVDTPGEYFVTVTNENGCSSTASVEVFADVNTPVAEAGEGDELNCLNPTIELNSILSSLGQDYIYSWSSLNGNIVSGGDGLSPIVDAPGVYEILVTNEINGCTSTDDVTVTLNDAVPSGASIRTVQPCYGETKGQIMIDSVIGGISPYVFSFDSLPFTTFSDLNPAQIGEHQIVIQDATGCEWETAINVTPQPELLVDLGPDQRVALGCEVELHAITNYSPSEIDTLIWNTDLVCSPICDTTFIVLDEITYRVLLRDINGCEVRDDLKFSIDKDRNVYIPNAFSPNDDGVNDDFLIFGGKDVTVVKTFRVFNRWGEVIHQADNFPANDPSYGWNGDLKGKRMTDQVFVYYAEVEFLDGWIEVYQGDVTIVK